jgi:hypothetical protein
VRPRPQNILRLEPKGAAAEIDLEDWRGAVTTLPPLANSNFEANNERIASLFIEKVVPRYRFYTMPEIRAEALKVAVDA